MPLAAAQRKAKRRHKLKDTDQYENLKKECITTTYCESKKEKKRTSAPNK
jgi:hypothetical protein